MVTVAVSLIGCATFNEIYVGTISSFIGSMTSLNYLNISSNKLSGMCIILTLSNLQYGI